MNKVSSWNKLNIAQAKLSPKTQQATWPASRAETWRELHLKIQFPKRNNRLPGQTVRPTIFCLYSFFSVECSYRFRLRKNWKNPKIAQVMGKIVKTQNEAPSARARAETDSDQPGVTSKSFWPIFMQIFFLSDQNWASYSLRREICVSFESSFLYLFWVTL
jgi:hypothetical protein